MQYINVGVEWNLQRSIFIPHKRDMISGNKKGKRYLTDWKGVGTKRITEI